PCYQGYTCPEIMALMEHYGVSDCYYGHLHGGSHKLAIEGKYGQIRYHLVAADYVNFKLQKILD
ncbi:MAG: serine/threonine protein phosphatase, partial [Oscillospiraceae bacterium]